MDNQATLPSIHEMTRADLAEWCEKREISNYRADQIRRWIFGKRVSNFDDMHDVPADVRETLKNSFQFFSSTLVSHQVASDRTEKLLLQFSDGEHAECVLMREPKRRTVCISTQVGCAMGCVFCASGLLGLKRNLSRSEILEQVLRIDRLLPADERLTNVVVMGIGEPLANLSNLLPVLETLNEKGGMGLGARRTTISTVGLPDKIRELAGVGKAYNLAISLHAPNEKLRTELVPVNKSIGLAEVMQAADDYFDITGRRVTYEYVLMGNINDSAEEAEQLVKLLKGRRAHVNLIPLNDVEELPFRDPGTPRTNQFLKILQESGIVATVRKRKGADIDAACGQLRRKELSEEPLVTLDDSNSTT